MKPTNRRKFLETCSVAGASSLFLNHSLSTASGMGFKKRAEHVISIWLGGGMSQIDTFDPKVQGDPVAKKPGSYYASIPTAVEGVRVTEHLSKLAPLMDRVTAIRTIHHDTIDEHAAATNRMHTGRAISDTITYPSLGSIVAHELGAKAQGIPPYVVIGYPNITRGPGFLGSQYGYLYLTDTSQGPAGLSRPAEITDERQARRLKLLGAIRNPNRSVSDSRVDDYARTIEQSLDLSGPEFSAVFDLDREPADLRNQYGGEFGQRCLLSRRLVERGVRFIEVSHNLNFLNGIGWDVHNDGILKQYRLIQELDIAVSALIQDLEQKRLLDRTLIMITTEFGRPPEFDSGGGRGHQGRAFTCVLAGGGLRHHGAWGATDELSKKIVSDPVSLPDFFATICASLGIDPSKSLYNDDRPIPITDRGKPVQALLPNA
ncbi:MAG: DUF1501 domain-containing protein [Planctomycetota bacterium]|jgi:hypothetical protein|nr:DUF1501 domain-containing protein [Planctomycetota bacterium]MEC7717796.1 DUF1501 domain-containing protein [Planctomycetota bacterium]MEC7978909.1 DUF1501 domain-containing protein [Planctomycetota bacterium]MEC8570780.1 DUF1501 domain-containing protein [Planctomycetota bacterium]MEC8783718.1 DUF1501 domain-containing protein [Planctomycetota bacterium]